MDAYTGRRDFSGCLRVLQKDRKNRMAAVLKRRPRVPAGTR